MYAGGRYMMGGGGCRGNSNKLPGWWKELTFFHLLDSFFFCTTTSTSSAGFYDHQCAFSDGSRSNFGGCFSPFGSVFLSEFSFNIYWLVITISKVLTCLHYQDLATVDSPYPARWLQENKVILLPVVAQPMVIAYPE